VSSLADLRTGDLGFGPIHGGVGALVGAGELLVAPFDHWSNWREWRKVRHCGWVTRPATTAFRLRTSPVLGQRGAAGVGPMFAQAMPSGFEIVEMGFEHWTDEWIYLRPFYNRGQADRMAMVAERMAHKHIPYGFEDYAAIAAHRAGVHVKPVDDFIARLDADGDPYRAICSQALDSSLSVTGGLLAGKVFNDGRLPQDITPSELFLQVQRIGTEAVIRPGRSV
jgi:hypothetical protein